MFTRYEQFSYEVALCSHTSAVGIASLFSHTAPLVFKLYDCGYKPHHCLRWHWLANPRVTG